VHLLFQEKRNCVLSGTVCQSVGSIIWNSLSKYCVYYLEQFVKVLCLLSGTVCQSIVYYLEQFVKVLCLLSGTVGQSIAGLRESDCFVRLLWPFSLRRKMWNTTEDYFSPICAVFLSIMVH
jgi:hypothetical protein